VLDDIFINNEILLMTDSINFKIELDSLLKILIKIIYFPRLNAYMSIYVFLEKRLGCSPREQRNFILHLGRGIPAPACMGRPVGSTVMCLDTFVLEKYHCMQVASLISPCFQRADAHG
jgi:hypothetical protein